MTPIRILIADDHPMFRFGLRALLTAEPDTVVIGEATSGRQVIEMAAQLTPDVILMDINMPEISGIEATRQIFAANPDIGILVITMFEDDTVFAAIRAGARGYILKGAEGEETIRAIRAVANGESIFSPAIAQRLTKFIVTAPTVEAPLFPDLTPREREILVLIAQGLTNSAIAEHLSLSPKTVRNQVSSVLSKLNVTSRAEAIVKARQAGLR
jgi:DNA-binding NarL/FixJ family response regulator